MAAKPKNILTVDQLAATSGITENQARELMQSADFPATQVVGGAFVVHRDMLERWTLYTARTVAGINDLP